MKKDPNKVKTRFAPSPTGALHIGSARTALFNFLFAKQKGGEMLLRIEDTDKERSKKEYEDDILNGLTWLGMDWGETYRQSERGDIYKKYLEKMIENGSAYISKEEPKEEGQRSEVIRFRNPNVIIKFDDLIRGDIEFNTSDLGDFVIAKDKETPLYHLAVVVDDFEMNITHVIRGEDGISNTPRQILIQEAIGAPRPIYAHIPLILAPDKSKLSKRHGAVPVLEYKKEGYLPEAMINFLALMGWSPQSAGIDKDIISFEDLVKIFDIEKVQKGGAVFDANKLNWINKEYIKLLPKEKIKEELEKILQDKDSQMIDRIIPIIIDRISKWGDVQELIETGELTYFFEEPSYEASAINWKEESSDKTAEYLEKLLSILSDIAEKDFMSENIKAKIWDYAGEKGRGNVLWPMRFALSGKQKSPDPFTLAEILGKETSIKRLENALKKLE